jgi:hypothetical protein
MTRITSLGIKRSHKDAQFNTLFEPGGGEAIAEKGANNLNENVEGPAMKKRKRGKEDADGVQTRPSVGSGVGKNEKSGKKYFAANFSGAKPTGAPSRLIQC